MSSDNDDQQIQDVDTGYEKQLGSPPVARSTQEPFLPSHYESWFPWDKIQVAWQTVALIAIVLGVLVVSLLGLNQLLKKESVTNSSQTAREEIQPVSVKTHTISELELRFTYPLEAKILQQPQALAVTSPETTTYVTWAQIENYLHEEILAEAGIIAANFCQNLANKLDCVADMNQASSYSIENAELESYRLPLQIISNDDKLTTNEAWLYVILPRFGQSHVLLVFSHGDPDLSTSDAIVQSLTRL